MPSIMLERSGGIKRNLFDLRKNLRYPPKPGEKAMTVSAGFLCRDGIVICADREITHEDVGKTQETKVWSNTSGNTSFVVTGAGDFAYLSLAAERLLADLATCDAIEGAYQQIGATLRGVFDDIQKDSRIFTAPPSVV